VAKKTFRIPQTMAVAKTFPVYTPSRTHETLKSPNKTVLFAGAIALIFDSFTHLQTYT
jgi:hypothetical protein